MMTQVPMTKEGAEKLKAELEQLKFVDRRRITEAIASARELGDLKENAEYHAAREQQAFTEGRIQEIESKLNYAQIIDVSTLPKSERVVFGATVTLINLETNEEVKYQIVGEDEADIKLSKISVTSPIARGIIGKNIDDSVVIATPNGEVEYEISNVEYI